MPDPTTFSLLYGVQRPDLTIAQATACYEPIGSAPKSFTYDCNLLPACNLTCSGPNEVLLSYAAFYTGCRTEWLIHSVVMRGFLALLIYVCINVSRANIVDAVCRLNWRSLTTEGFTFTASCSRTGKTTLNVKTKLKTAVDRTVKAFEQSAIVMFLLAVVVHLPYLICMAVLQSPVVQ